MKKGRLKEIIREEISKVLNEAQQPKFNDLMDAFTKELKSIKEYGSESMYFSAPGGVEQASHSHVPRTQHYTSYEKWKVVAMQLGAVISDRGDDWLAVMPNQDKLGTFSKMTRIGTLNL